MKTADRIILTVCLLITAWGPAAQLDHWFPIAQVGLILFWAVAGAWSQ